MNVMRILGVVGFAVGVVTPTWVHASEFFVFGNITRQIPRDPIILDSYELIAGLSAGHRINHDQFEPGEPSWHAQADSLADSGGVRAHAFVSLFKPSTRPIEPGGTYSASAFARATFNDFVIDGPGNSVVAPIRFRVTGSLSAGASAATENRRNTATSNALVSFRINNGASNGGTIGQFVDNGVSSPLTTTGLLTGFDGDDILTIPDLLLPVGSLFSVSMELTVQTILSYNSFEPTFTSSANVAFDHTVTFATDGAIFGLPEGYTVNSVSARIVDNQLAPVPVPPALWLLSSALVPFAGRVRARSRAV